jgi:3,4-dihydroxyphenylacetate 2,3-dioxygenase
MDSGIIAGIITSHTPRMGVEETAPDFVQPLIAGSKQLGEWIREQAPDVIVLHTTHWVSTFNWYATCHAVHVGRCVAEEAPELIGGLPYQYRGDPEFAQTLIEAAKARDVPFLGNDCEHYHWDYGTYVPMKYLDPEAELAVVSIPTVIMADLDECMNVGRAVHDAATTAGKRVMFIASTALTHLLVRGPATWPLPEHQELDFKLLDMLREGRVAEAIAWFPEYANIVKAEMGGRVVAGLIGALDAMAEQPYGSRTFSDYAQSSASGNICIAFSPSL